MSERPHSRDIDETSLRSTPKGDRHNGAIASAICERTTLRQDRIAERLQLKSPSNASQRVLQYLLLDPEEKSRAMKA